jgi:hypothetical protein
LRSSATLVAWLAAGAASLALAAGGGDELPDELAPFVPNDHEALDFATGDLDGDGRADAVLILKGPDEVREKDDMEALRPLLLLVRQPDGRLKQERRADRIVYCRTCGGMMGDPYMETVVETGRFTVSHYGGSAWRWGADYTFAYDPASKDWFLDREKTTSFHATDPDGTRAESTLTREQLGDFPIEGFDAVSDPDQRNWRVAAARAYFYDRPDPGSRPRKAYLVTGDVVESWRELRSFVQGRSTNRKGDTTSGFLLKRDLEALPDRSAP